MNEKKTVNFERLSRLHDRRRDRGILLASQRRVQHVLGALHLVHHTVEGGQKVQANRRLPRSLSHNEGKVRRICLSNTRLGRKRKKQPPRTRVCHRV